MTDAERKILQTLFNVIPDMTEKQKEGFMNFADGYSAISQAEWESLQESILTGAFLI